MPVFITNTNQELEKMILKAFVDSVNEDFAASFKKTTDKLKKIVIEEIEASPEYDSLVNGKLRAELGVVNGVARMRKILQVLVDRY